MSFEWIDLLGYAAAVSTVIAFYCRRMAPLRLAAICANLLFVAYGAALGLYPIVLLHAVLLPLNVARLLLVRPGVGRVGIDPSPRP